MCSTDATASRIRFKDAGFNLVEVLINFGPGSPTATVSLHKHVCGWSEQLLDASKVVSHRTVQSLVLRLTVSSLVLQKLKHVDPQVFCIGEINHGHILTQDMPLKMWGISRDKLKYNKNTSYINGQPSIHPFLAVIYCKNSYTEINQAICRGTKCSIWASDGKIGLQTSKQNSKHAISISHASNELQCSYIFFLSIFPFCFSLSSHPLGQVINGLHLGRREQSFKTHFERYRC